MANTALIRLMIKVSPYMVISVLSRSKSLIASFHSTNIRSLACVTSKMNLISRFLIKNFTFGYYTFLSSPLSSAQQKYQFCDSHLS